MLISRSAVWALVLLLTFGATWRVTSPSVADAAENAKKKIVLIAGPITGHPKQTHEYEKSVILLKHLLDTSPAAAGLVTECHFHGWPENPQTLEDADTIAFISDGGDRNREDHPLYVGDRIRVIETQMKRGCGLVMLHWSTFHPSDHHQQVTEWVGGYFDYEKGAGPRHWYSAIQTWEGEALPTPDHPVTRGVRPFRVKEEFYYRMRFRDNDPRVTPVVRTRPPGEPEDQTVGWAVQRDDGGRGFGFTGGHFYDNWWLPDFRKLVLNALVWTAHGDVPTTGIAAKLDEPIRALVLTGHNHPAHEWRSVTAALIQVLEQDPRILVDVTEDLEELKDEKIKNYDLLVMNYSNWDRPGLSAEAKRGFLDYLKRGGGLAVIHFANGAFTDTIPNKESDWEEYRTRVVRRIWVHGDDKSGHDAFGLFRVEITPTQHPITAGLQPFDTMDELYFRQMGELPIEPLATARSRITGRDEPMAFAYPYEKGRIFQTVLGHADQSVRMAGTLIRRGSTWAAGRDPLGFDPPVELTANYLFRDGANWSPAASKKRAEAAGEKKTSMLPKPGPALVDGRFGQALDARVHGAFVATTSGTKPAGAAQPDAANSAEGQAGAKPSSGPPPESPFRHPPLTVECWARLAGKQNFNILVANERKSSATHWELFTEAQSGNLAVYLPGYVPDHARSSKDLCDGEWHFIAMRFSSNRVRLHVDGQPVADQALRFAGGKTVPGELAIGSLGSRTLGCDGLLDDVRVSRGVRGVEANPTAALDVDDRTVGLWSFDELAKGGLPDAEHQVADRSPAQRRATLVAAGTKITSEGTAPKITGHWGEAETGIRWQEEFSVDGRWNDSDVGPMLATTLPIAGEPVPKGLVIKCGDRAGGSVCFDTDQLVMRGGWLGGFLEFDPRRYGLIAHPKVLGNLVFHRPGDSGHGEKSRRFLGCYRHGERVVLSYQIGGAELLESPWLEQHGDVTAITRTLQIKSREAVALPIVVATGARVDAINDHVRALVEPGDRPATMIAVAGDGELENDGSRIQLRVAPRSRPAFVKLLFWKAARPPSADELVWLNGTRVDDLAPLTKPGPALWTEPIVTRGEVSDHAGPWVVDTLTLPFDNPYRALMFVGGHDFFSNGDAAICTIHGDVWIVSGIDARLERLRWKRFATGLFQPLGLRIVNDVVHVLGKDQITQLHDRDQDGEADYYQNFSNSGQTSVGNHDYATCLETDSAGNFYYLRANSGLVRVAKGGESEEIVATGFRNPCGMGIGPNDVITVSPQEGEWTPASAVCEVRAGGHYGFGGPRVSRERPLGYDRPLFWLPRLTDNSAAGQTWVEGNRWGVAPGQLLHFSFGRCWMLWGLRDEVDGIAQGGVVPLPIVFESGAMRGRFRSQDGQLYVSGAKGWGTSAQKDGCFHRVRYVGGEVQLPDRLQVHANGILIRFMQPMDRSLAEDADRYFVQQWNYRYASTYGSPEYRASSASQEGRDDVEVRSATLLEDERSVFLEIDRLQPVMQMAIAYKLASANGQLLEQTISHTINHVPSRRLEPASHAARDRPGQLAAEVEKRLAPGWVVREKATSSRSGSSFAAVHATRLAAWSSRPKNDSEPMTAREIASLTGFLKIPLPGRYALHVGGMSSGRPADATLRVNGVNVPLVEDAPDVSSTPMIALHRGYNAIQLALAPQAKLPAGSSDGLRIEWSSAEFAREPIPPTVLWHDSGEEEVRAASLVTRGRELYIAHRCEACHSSSVSVGRALRQELEQEAPNLHDAGRRFEIAWLARWMLAPLSVRNDARMPGLFDASSAPDRQQAADIAAWLGSLGAEPDANERVGVVGGNDNGSESARGEELFEQLGCIACHRTNPPQAEDEYDRGSLHFVVAKFRPGTLEAFLRSPHQRFTWSRMPDFRLSESEASSLASYLAANATGKVVELAELRTADSKRGARLFDSRGCSQCHRVEETNPQESRGKAPRSQESPLKPARIPLAFPASTAVGCLATNERARGAAPSHRLEPSDRAALEALLRTDGAALDSETAAEQAERLVRQLDCTACHGRDARTSRLGEVLLTESTIGRPLEVLPSLTWIGEKLRPEWTSHFLRDGSATRPLRPWLVARMPAFPAHAELLARGFAAQHAQAGESARPSPAPADVEVGKELTTRGRGLDCRQCHGLADSPPEGDENSRIALGVNLSHMAARLQKPYYDRWMRDPTRIDPQTKMPRLVEGGRTRLRTVLDGDAEKQFETIWAYLQSLDPQ